MIEIVHEFHDGKAEITVKGVKGASCKTITADLEQKLGTVTSTEPTREMNEREVNIATNRA